MVEYLKETLKPHGGKVIAGDSDRFSPALYHADDYVILQPINDEGYISSVIDACKRKEIDAIIPLIEEEVPQLVKNHSVLSNLGVKLITSEQDMVDICTDKLKTYQYIKELGYPGVPTFSSVSEMKDLLEDDEFDYPLIVKPADGKASQGVHRVENEQELKEAVEEVGQPIIQPYLKEKEYGIDVYMDMISGELVDLFIKEKFEMAGGATDKSVSIRNDVLETMIKGLMNAANFIGPLDIDVFEWNGKYYISEINPRFGAGYLHAHEMGRNYMEYILKNIQDEMNFPFAGAQYPEGIVMMKYPEVSLRKFE